MKINIENLINNLYLEEFTNLFAFIILIIMSYYYYSKIMNFKYKRNVKKINKFIKFTQNKKNFENNLYTESMIFNRFNYYIKFEILEKILLLKNPTGIIYKYIELNKFFFFKNNSFILQKKYNSPRKLKFYKVSNFILGIVCFIFALISLTFFSTDFIELFIFVLYEITFIVGFFISTIESWKLGEVESFITNFNREVELLEKTKCF